MTNFEQYTEALRFLRESAEAIDQAHSCMKSAGLDDIVIRASLNGHTGFRDIEKLSGDVAAMAKEVENSDCNVCNHRLSQHGDKHGCEYERGDVAMPCKDGGDVMAAAGPCGCKWGQEVA